VAAALARLGARLGLGEGDEAPRQLQRRQGDAEEERQQQGKRRPQEQQQQRRRQEEQQRWEQGQRPDELEEDGVEWREQALAAGLRFWKELLQVGGPRSITHA
jgi:hypothetical protein